MAWSEFNSEKKEGKFKVYLPGKHEIEKSAVEGDGFSNFFEALIAEEKAFVLRNVNLKSEGSEKKDKLKDGIATITQAQFRNDGQHKDVISKKARNLSSLNKYEMPKEIFFVDQFIETETKKIQRRETLDLIFRFPPLPPGKRVRGKS